MLFCSQMPSVCNEIIEDIEDLISSQDIKPKERYSNKSSVTVRVKKRRNLVSCEEEILINEKNIVPSSTIPGTQKIYMKTWGCTHNGSDSEYMAGQLTAYGYKLTGE